MTILSDTVLETTEIASLVVRDSAATAVKRWNAFIPLHPAETARQPSPARLVNPGQNADWYQHGHAQVAEIPELGVNLIDHSIVCGHSDAFRDGRMLVDPSEPSRVAQQFAATATTPWQTAIATGRRVVLDPPALLLAGPGYGLWGHWLLDFLPRLGLAKAALGAVLDRTVVPLPNDAPDWVAGALRHFGGISAERIFRYHPTQEYIYCRRLVIPSIPHQDYFLHSYNTAFFQHFVAPTPEPTPKRLCISRRKFHQAMPNAPLQFAQAVAFEAAAEQRGYQLVQPETLSFAEQVALYAGAEVIIGSCGSGMHNAIFAPPGTIIGQIGMPNATQSRIAGLCGHQMVYLFPDQPLNPHEPMSISLEQIRQFFNAVEAEIETKGQDRPW